MICSLSTGDIANVGSNVTLSDDEWWYILCIRQRWIVISNQKTDIIPLSRLMMQSVLDLVVVISYHSYEWAGKPKVLFWNVMYWLIIMNVHELYCNFSYLKRLCAMSISSSYWSILTQFCLTLISWAKRRCPANLRSANFIGQRKLKIRPVWGISINIFEIKEVHLSSHLTEKTIWNLVNM